MNQSDPAILTIGDGIARIALNRPERLNVLDFPSAECLLDLFGRVERDDSVKAVTLTGAGRSFMAGGDLSEFHRDLTEAPQAASGLIALFHQLLRSIRRVKAPVIAGVQGPTAGGGLALALGCDIIIAAADARFIPAYTRLGTSPDGGTTWSVTHVLGPRRALEWIMLSEPMSAEAALSQGLINRVVPATQLAEEVDALAKRIAAGPALAYASVKRLVWQAERVSFDEQLEAERNAFMTAAKTADFREGISAFFERRPARFGEA